MVTVVTHQLLYDALHQLPECDLVAVFVGVVQVFDQLGYGLRVCLRLKREAFLHLDIGTEQYGA